jgi:hypothetical protein
VATRPGPAVAQVLGAAVLFGTTGTAQRLGPDGTLPLGSGRCGGVTEPASDAAIDAACRMLRLPTVRTRFVELADSGRVNR